MSIWPKWVPVESRDSLQAAIKHNLAIRRIGSELEGVVVEVYFIPRGAAIQYPRRGDSNNILGGSKKGSTHIITDLEKYEIKPTFLMQEYLTYLGMAMEVGEEFNIPRCQKDLPDLDILGIFLENDFLAWCLYGGDSTGQQAQAIKRKASQVITEAVKYIEQFGNDTGQLDARKTNQAKLEETKKNKLYFIETSLRILFWCYYCEIKRIPGSERYNNDTTTATAKIMDNNKLPLSLRFRAARIMYFWSETNDKKVSSSEKDQATNFLARIAGLTPEQIPGTEFSTKGKELIRLAKDELSGGTGIGPGCFY